MLMVVVSAGCSTSSVKLPGGEVVDIPLKQVSLNEFMGGQLSVKMPVTLSIPENYVYVGVRNMPAFSYWMPSNKIYQVQVTQELPQDTGWIYGNKSESVGYDKVTNEFFGDNGYSLRHVLSISGYQVLKSERVVVNGCQVIFLDVEEKSTRKRFYSMYIAMMVETDCIFIAYRPPLGNPEIGAYIWAELVKTVKESENTMEDTTEDSKKESPKDNEPEKVPMPGN